MKKISLLILSVIFTLTLVGCDGDNKTDCNKDPKAKGCPMYEGNIKRPEPKKWDFGNEDVKPSKEDK